MHKNIVHIAQTLFLKALLIKLLSINGVRVELVVFFL